jgi:D-sedoheptulose 7-phosphate isomerase
MEKHSLLSDFRSYFGLLKDGVNLRSSLENLPLSKLTTLQKSLKTRSVTSRVFVLGNGGSFDNSRWMTLMLRKLGISAKVPGAMDDYFQTMYAQSYASIYAEGLKQDKISKGDIVIGISGSGNSANVVNGLRYASDQGATIFAFGGRDGGKLKSVVPEENFLIVQNICMEAIEDLHNFVFYILFRALKEDLSIEVSHQKILAIYDGFLSDSNLELFQELAYGMIHSACHDGHVFILGLGLGANHFRADMNRGASNKLPIRGLSAPEVFNINSAEATANDDGPDFILADGLVKFIPSPKDFAILCDTGEHEELYEHCIDILDAGQTKHRSIGLRQGVDLSVFDREERDLPIMLIAHACGEVLRKFLHSQFSIREITLDQDFSGEDKKLGMKQTQTLEKTLQEAGLISSDEVITFCYGKTFAVKGNAGTVYKRCYY